MYLISKNQIVVKAVVYGAISVVLMGFLIFEIIRGDVVGIISYALCVVFYIFFWKKYIKAFKKRTYDREYFKAKEDLLETLNTLLPYPGKITFVQGGQYTAVHRDVIKFFKEDLFTILSAEIEVLYNDLAERKLIISIHSYSFSQGMLYVSKSFDSSLSGYDDDDNQQDDAVSSEIKLVTFIRNSIEASRSIPEDLRFASPQELRELHSLLLEGREEIVL